MDDTGTKSSKLSDRLLRNCRRPGDFFPVAAFLSVLISLLGTLLSQILFSMPLFEKLFDSITKGDENMYQFLFNYAAFLGIWIVLILIIQRKSNRPMKKLLKPDRRTLKHLAAGILLGFASNGFCILMSVLMGDIKLFYSGIDDPWPLVAFIIAIFIQSGAEELTNRMYLYSKLRRRYVWPAVAVIGNSLVFVLMHAANDGFTAIAAIQIFFVALLFSLIMYWYDGLWIVMAYHAAWNFCQSIFFGLPNSGIVSSYSVFRLDAASAENGLFYNVDFGVEGSVGAVLLLAIESLAVILLNRKKPEKNDIWAVYDVPPAVKVQELPQQIIQK